jgi:hypothetical protein
MYFEISKLAAKTAETACKGNKNSVTSPPFNTRREDTLRFMKALLIVLPPFSHSYAIECAENSNQRQQVRTCDRRFPSRAEACDILDQETFSR